MPWRRLGPLSLDVSTAPWAATHAALPIVDRLDDGRFAVYLSLRDGQGRARIGRTTLSMLAAPSLAPLDPEPVLDLGALGAFDDSGVTSSCIARSNGRQFLFYTGWSRGVTVPFYLSAGVAVSDGGPFQRLSQAPLLDRNPVDPYLTASPFVLVERTAWRMWYVSATGWRRDAAVPRHFYHIRYAESPDGITWQRSGDVCIDYASDDEHAFARPCVVHDNGVYRMWYAFRGSRYHIGYAESRDGVAWTRHDAEQGLDPAESGWDSSMVEYPFVFNHDGRRFMMYNGNDYGKTGVGLAVWEEG
jgi:hypothetical protein